MPLLVSLLGAGSDYEALADGLAAKYGRPVSAATVRSHVRQHAGALTAGARSRGPDRGCEVDREEAMRLARWVAEHASDSQTDAAGDLGLPAYRMARLLPLARTLVDGYVVPVPTVGREHFTDQEMAAVLSECAAALGIGASDALAQSRYKVWRESVPAERKEAIPSPIAYLRRYGTWSAACRLSGLNANTPSREYDGLEEADIVLHVAVWLRSLRTAGRGIVEATKGEYGQWLVEHPEAPSEEMIKLRATWANILSEASALERKQPELGTPKPIGVRGRTKGRM